MTVAALDKPATTTADRQGINRVSITFTKGYEMNVDNFTIGEVKALLAMFGGAPAQTQQHPAIGQYVIVRCKDAGVHAGKLVSMTGRECTLEDARRLWYWKPAKGAWLDGVSLYGLHEDSKVGAMVDIRILTENCEITVCSELSEDSVRGAIDYVP